MARFYDRLMRWFPRKQAVILRNAVVFKIDNVYEYLTEQGHDVPILNAAPPYPIMFFEHHIGDDTTAGYAFQSFEQDQIDVVDQLLFKFPNTEQFRTKIKSDAKWVILASLYVDFVKAELYQWVIGIDDFGQFVSDKPEVSWVGGPTKFYESMNLDRSPGMSKKVLKFIHCPLFAIALMHAKNTELIDNPPPAKLSKRHEKKYGVPLVTYKTLKVNPIRKVNANDYDDDDSEGESIPKSLHIARGHFKDYRNGPGLFGKYQDIFWWDAHVRGSAKQGVVVKDYDVQAPDDES